ncbi:hypothetical protein O181_043337 [Austropuccinia psidii MF-1]|uniref:Uncharacterized protein n=1 Tax=Austropuccinia psidii MF-1 TaxID=1389203 RepID=A0A9Q3HGQ6_9BASI|nr:hypothetical protein [Austropuccinia psidii MF-1]
MSEKEFVRHFAKEEEKFTKKILEKSNPPPKQQEPIVIKDHKVENKATIAQIEEWENWKPPQISPSNENFQTNFGLRQKRQKDVSQESKSLT